MCLFKWVGWIKNRTLVWISKWGFLQMFACFVGITSLIRWKCCMQCSGLLLNTHGHEFTLIPCTFCSTYNYKHDIKCVKNVYYFLPCLLPNSKRDRLRWPHDPKRVIEDCKNGWMDFSLWRKKPHSISTSTIPSDFHADSPNHVKMNNKGETWE